MLKIFSLLAVIIACVGCSSFQRDWRVAANVSSSSIAGRWEGSWRSDITGHSDQLRCILTQIGENQYEARFHAKYRKVLSFGYTAAFSGITTNGMFHFNGEANLGKMAGGVYYYNGAISPTAFDSTYRSKYDKGTFTLHRPE